VVEGMDVIDRISVSPTGPMPPFKEDAPLQAVVIQKIELLADVAPPTPAGAPAGAPAEPAAPPATPPAPAPGEAPPATPPTAPPATPGGAGDPPPKQQ